MLMVQGLIHHLTSTCKLTYIIGLCVRAPHTQTTSHVTVRSSIMHALTPQGIAQCRTGGFSDHEADKEM